MVGWPHRLDGHESGQAPGGGEGQGGLASCSPWGRSLPSSSTSGSLQRIGAPPLNVCRREQ